MRFRLLVVPALGLVLSAGLAMAQGDAPQPVMERYDGQVVVRATAQTQQHVLALTSLAESVWSHQVGIGDIDIQIRAERLAALDDLGIKYALMIPDLQGAVEAERADIAARRLNKDLSWFANYKTLAEINTYLDTLTAQRPDLASTFSAATVSVEGRPIRAIRITGPDQPGNPKNQRAAVLYNGCQHAREWVSPMTIMYFADQLIEKYNTDPRVRSVVDNAEIILVPVVNPDGYNHSWTTSRLWRKNRRNNGDGSFGVDNNRNWGFQWGGEGASAVPSNDTYRGPSAFSEPETRALRDIVLANPRIEAAIDFHSYSQLILSPYGYTSVLPPDAALFNQLNTLMVNEIRSAYGLTYTAGPTYTTIYPASGGALDWFYGGAGTLGFTIELRDTGTNGFLLPADQIIPTAEENFRAILGLTEFVSLPLRLSWPAGEPTVSFPSDTTSPVDVTIVNGTGTLNPASVLLWTSIDNGPWTSSPMTLVSGSTYRGTFPAVGCGLGVRYYVAAATTAGRGINLPSGGENGAVAAVAQVRLTPYVDACESLGSWSLSVPTDTATTGRWENADPQRTNYQPEDDRTLAGTRCFVTGAAAGTGDGSFDVDGGNTTLTSPVFSAVPGDPDLNVASTTLTYWRWFGVNNTDTFLAQISTNGGTTWQNLESITTDARAWTGRAFELAGIYAPTANMRLRFVTGDTGTASLVEAAVDDISVEIIGCPYNPADINRDGSVDLADFFEFFACYDQSLPCADIDDSGDVDLVDFFGFFSAYDQA